MEKERRITAPDGCEIEKVEIVDGVAVATFKKKDRYLPKSWEEFCEMFPIKESECYINEDGYIYDRIEGDHREFIADRSTLPDRATAEAVLALCQLVQLRDCYNGDWVPDWKQEYEDKYFIVFDCQEIVVAAVDRAQYSPLYFKSTELCEEFLHNFRPLIEKIKPLYGIKEGGDE